ncbi:MAG TPA: bifunctional adenosylcobinamide kinase/adenosylcobinamide-phosphate guanylyltransferase [Bryobacteraceae bacterium]|nr:bifunctional adenosylcobinamide kinase/adenosylcobinamide-phosphate guanylyltransferase [Bryobacteraceae bacterium]
MLTLILGGARSGKSRFAQRMAAAAERVCYIATLLPGDDAEMGERVARHQADRPESWRTIEEPLALADAIERAARDAEVVLVDCLTLWLSNLAWEHRASGARQLERIARTEIRRIADAARNGRVIVVSNEVGSGTVPESPVARAFRDLQGFANQWMAEAAGEVVLIAAGLPLYLKGGPGR